MAATVAHATDDPGWSKPAGLRRVSQSVYPVTQRGRCDGRNGKGGRVGHAFDLIWQLGRLASLGLGGVLAATGGIAAVYAAGAVLMAAGLVGRAGLARDAHAISGHEVRANDAPL